MSRLAYIVVLGSVVACSGDSNTSTGTETSVATSIQLSDESVLLSAVGETSQLTATVKDQNGYTIGGAAVTWSSADDGVATVSSSGLVTAVANGSTTVTATSGSASEGISATVAQVAAALTLDAGTIRLAAAGDTVRLVAAVTDANGVPMDGAEVSWASDDTLVARIDSAGLVTAVGTGLATITATSGGVAASASAIAVPFYLAENGVTIVCAIAQVGDTATVNGLIYTKRSRAQIDALVVAADYVPLGTTCTSGIEDMAQLLEGAATFNEDIGSWDVSSVTNMRRVFRDAVAFNQPIGNWDVSIVRTMQGMFYGAAAFNQPIGSWDVGSVADVALMFLRASSFNQDIGAWDVSGVLYMQGTFQEATAFNADIGAWDVSSVLTMYQTFFYATAFNADLSGWCVSDIATAPTSFDEGATAWVLPRPVWGTCP
jgi:uncharacterized protein YjdB